ncbi:DUF722 domain-containing protein [Weissella diestrammenae]|uniref:DUF722 domain-containing protein n=1 Tax=Weissella diestrammenae TaxID=1162633 RepID=A0A7G9T4P8_9LACO|nr:DUF722 domain-containing protein [Weissella diestrammenae]MCM0582780.1 DUF722 domain-containing protein [Weissella diestrammenae]QNN75073.1 DUF722 domain-containing protein [Weissella diestrammenae]
MADRIDKLLTDYFKGKLDLNIAIRKIEINHSSEQDENVGGGRAQNKYNDPNAIAMIREDEDVELQVLITQENVISKYYDNLLPEHKRAISNHYRNNLTWQMIAFSEYVDERTARRWRDDFKFNVKKDLKTMPVLG